VWRDGRSATVDDLAHAMRAAAHRVASPFQLRACGPAVLGFAASKTQPERQPVQSPDGMVTLVFDGRLDDRAGLAAALGCGSDVDSAALVLAAYGKWGAAGPAHLIGDFALAIWDAREARLVCARDALGQRPLFYGLGVASAIVASEPQQVLCSCGIDASVNEGIVAEILAGGPATMGETLWSGVRRLPPAHVLAISRDGAVITRYWDFDQVAPVRFRDPRDYAHAFDELFTRAIESRVRAARSAGVFLSGGIDSSAVAAVAADLRDRGRAGAITAISLSFPGEACDESAHVRAVADHARIESRFVPAGPPSPLEIRREAARYADTPQYPNGLTMQPLRALARELGLDVVLTGYGGDDWFTGSLWHTTDLLRGGRLVAAGRQWISDASLPGLGYTRAGLARLAVAPLVPARVRSLLRPLARGRRPTLEWIRPEFAARVDLHERLRPRPTPPFETEVQRDMYRVATSAGQAIGDELEDRAAHAAGIDQRHPFNDRRVVEFGFAIPESQRWHGRETKVVIRRALRPLLPASIAVRQDKAEFSATYVTALEALGGAGQFDRLQSEENGWVDGEVIRRQYADMLRRYRSGDDSYVGLTGSLWAVASLELWLSHCVSRGGPW
jgi:asparagine synthase (glutamine-hydrolysing)